MPPLAALSRVTPTTALTVSQHEDHVGQIPAGRGGATRQRDWRGGRCGRGGVRFGRRRRRPGWRGPERAFGLGSCPVALGRELLHVRVHAGQAGLLALRPPAWAHAVELGLAALALGRRTRQVLRGQTAGRGPAWRTCRAPTLRWQLSSAHASSTRRIAPRRRARSPDPPRPPGIGELVCLKHCLGATLVRPFGSTLGRRTPTSPARGSEHVHSMSMHPRSASAR